MRSLKALNDPLSDSNHQVEILENSVSPGNKFPSFVCRLHEINLFPLKPTGIEIFQVNLGKMCNQTCKHCHVDAGPDRKEIMTKETMELCLDILSRYDIPIVDITGGAPEMNTNFRWFVEECSKLGKKIINRCNLTIVLANKKFNDLPDFFAAYKVEVISSLPFHTAERTDKQRGEGVFDDSIKVLRLLNEIGYGKENSELILNLVYNPSGAFLPPSQQSMEEQFKRTLLSEHGVTFNQLFTITNMPISRFLSFLLKSGNYNNYMEKLVNAFNPHAANAVMCRNTISVGWDGYLYDCDFNQMLNLKVAEKNSDHLRDFDFQKMVNREIVLNQHCYGCTAGSGSSCGGAVA